MSIEKKPFQEYTTEDRAADEIELAKLVAETRERTTKQDIRAKEELIEMMDILSDRKAVAERVAHNLATHNELYQKIIGEVKGEEGQCVEFKITESKAPTPEENKLHLIFIRNILAQMEIDFLSAGDKLTNENLERNVNGQEAIHSPAVIRMAELNEQLDGVIARTVDGKPFSWDIEEIRIPGGGVYDSYLCHLYGNLSNAKFRVSLETPEEMVENMRKLTGIGSSNNLYYVNSKKPPAEVTPPLTYLQRQRLYYTPRG